MWNTYKYTIITLLKERNVLIWALLFPLIMSTLFNIMFSGLDESLSFKAIPTAIVVDKNYEDADAFEELVNTLSEPGDDQIFEAHFVDDAEAAEALLEEGTVTGYYLINDEGEPELFTVTPSGLEMTGSVNQTILKDIADNYLRSYATVETLLDENPTALSDPATIESLFQTESYTEAITVTANDASGSVRYFYALLGFASIMAALIAMVAVIRTQANLSPLGARRSMSALSRGKTLIASLLASWTLAYFCLLLAFVYMRFVLDVGFGGRDGACLLGLLISSLLATSLGAVIGSIPKLGEGTKSGLLTGLTCLLALFAGLYGTPSQNLADELSRTAPVAQMLNPSKQISDLFYSLYFYDTYDQFFTTAVILLTTTAVLFLVASIFMRRQRYASI